jgi:hypothetical protein
MNDKTMTMDGKTVNVVRGSWIRARWFGAVPASLTGAQLKTGATLVEVSGIVRHIRCKNPDPPTDVIFFIDPDPGLQNIELCRPQGCTCAAGHIAIKLQHVIDAEERISN